MIKVYEYNSNTVCAAQLSIPVGKAFMKIDFERGQKGNGAQSQGATYVSHNSLEQMLIENSELFKNGTIRLKREIITKPAQPVKAAKKPAAAKLTEVKTWPAEKDPEPAGETGESIDGGEIPVSENSYPEVTTKAALTKILKSKGAKATDLVSDDAIQAFADKLGLEFPNYKF